jgi:AcrR family transcriptional regulator
MYPVGMSEANPGPSKRRAQTRARLIDAALDLFVERGMHGTTIELICERAGFTRGAFYSNFGSLDELFAAIYASRSQSSIAELSAGLADIQGDVADDLEGVIERLLGHLPDDRPWHVIMSELTLAAMRSPELAESRNADRVVIVKALAPVVVSSLEAIGRAPDEDPEQLTADLLAVYESTAAARWAGGDEHATARVMAAVLRGSTHEI